MRHPSKLDWWLVSLVGAGLVLSAGGGLLVLLRARSSQELWLGGAGVAIAVAVVLCTWPVRYEIAQAELRIRAGLFRFRIPLAWIQGVRPSTNPLSAPAWSLRRLRVDYRRPAGRAGFQLISPRDREAFLRELAAADAGLVLDERTWELRRAAGGPGGRP